MSGIKATEKSVHNSGKFAIGFFTISQKNNSKTTVFGWVVYGGIDCLT